MPTNRHFPANQRVSFRKSLSQLDRDRLNDCTSVVPLYGRVHHASRIHRVSACGGCGATVLDLDELALPDIDAVGFLVAIEAEGVTVHPAQGRPKRADDAE